MDSLSFRCEQCDLLDVTLATIRSLIRENSNISEENKIRLMKSMLILQKNGNNRVNPWRPIHFFGKVFFFDFFFVQKADLD